MRNRHNCKSPKREQLKLCGAWAEGDDSNSTELQLATPGPFRALALALAWGAGAQTSARGRTERKLHPRASEVVVRSWRALRLKIAVRRGKGVLRPCTWPDGCGGPLGAALSVVSAPLRRNLSGRPKHETERRFAPVRRTSRGKRRVRLQRDGSGGMEYEKDCRSELANTGGMHLPARPLVKKRKSALKSQGQRQDSAVRYAQSPRRAYEDRRSMDICRMEIQTVKRNTYHFPTIFVGGGCHSSTRS